MILYHHTYIIYHIISYFSYIYQNISHIICIIYVLFKHHLNKTCTQDTLVYIQDVACSIVQIERRCKYDKHTLNIQNTTYDLSIGLILIIDKQTDITKLTF